MRPPKPFTIKFVDTVIEPEWNQDLFTWIYPIPLYWYGKDVRHCRDWYIFAIFKREYLYQFNIPIDVKFYRETDIDGTQTVGYICCN